ncbi:MAG: mannitol-1-phosphate 5-dehydrogenase [Firmicutes bacterium]|nr:mannitol-1-phosphate 5-dehydrogenase [Bacillota bacterium]
MKSSVQFGAGKIGRGLVGRLFIQSGYDVLFVDANKELVEALSNKRAYTVKTIGDDPHIYHVEGFRVTDVDHRDEIARAVAVADIVTTSVGPTAVKAVVPLIREGLELRAKGIDVSVGAGAGAGVGAGAAGRKPLNIVACENIPRASSVLRGYILEGCSPECRRFVEENVGFPEAQIGTIAPTILQPIEGEDPLTVFTESNEEFYIHKLGLVGGVPDVKGVHFVDDIDAYVERKVFVVNTGHAVAAYTGYLKGYEFIHESMRDPETRAIVEGALDETSRLLVAQHGFDAEEQRVYTARALRRFANADMKDPISRLGREPLRKLGPSDRLVRPARMAMKFGIVPDDIATGIAAALFYDAPSDAQAVELAKKVAEIGVEGVLREVSEISMDEELGRLVAAGLEKVRAMRKKGE